MRFLTTFNGVLRRLPLGSWVPIALIGTTLLFGSLALLDAGGPDNVSDAPALPKGAQAQIDLAARRLDQPGLYVARPVPLGRIDGAAYTEINDQIAKSEPAIRIAVVPARTAAQAKPETLLAALHARVRQPGIYAVLIDGGAEDGKGVQLAASQWADARPYYDVDQAVRSALSCCPKDYPALLERFVADTDSVKRRPLVTAASILLGLLATAVMAVAVALWLQRNYAERTDGPVVRAVKAEIEAELEEIERRAASFPPIAAKGADRLGHRYAHARSIVRDARKRFEEMRLVSDLEEVVAYIADFRFQLIAIDALRQGKPAPTRPPPCFLDPRHSPAVEIMRFTPPESLTTREVDLCARCAKVVAANQRPVTRRLPTPSGAWQHYWEAGRGGQAYATGYRVVVPFAGESDE